MDSGVYNVRKATCGQHCVWCNGETKMWIDVPAIGVGGNAQLTSTDQWNTGYQYDLTDESYWTSYETNIATIGSTTGLATGISAGTATFEAQAQDFLYVYSCAAPACPVQGKIQASGNGTVTKPTATVTLRDGNTEQVSATDGVSTLYKGYVGSLNLGIISGKWGVNNNGCIAGSELVGAVSPSTFTGNVTVKRTVTSEGCWQGSAPIACPAPGLGDDTGDWYTTNPQENTPGGSANGQVYNLDAPGISELKNTSSPVRVRFNFTAYAVGPDGITKIAPDVTYYVRISCMNNSAGVAQLKTDGSSSDNQIGLGSTKTTWNLQ
jgi:hypothetical protein